MDPASQKSMNSHSRFKECLDSGAPFGTRPRRSVLPLIVVALFYAAFFLALLWMALKQTHRL